MACVVARRAPFRSASRYPAHASLARLETAWGTTPRAERQREGTRMQDEQVQVDPKDMTPEQAHAEALRRLGGA